MLVSVMGLNSVQLNGAVCVLFWEGAGKGAVEVGSISLRVKGEKSRRSLESYKQEDLTLSFSFWRFNLDKDQLLSTSQGRRTNFPPKQALGIITLPQPRIG